MKNLARLITPLAYFLSATAVLAQSNPVIKVESPNVGYPDLGTFITAVLQLVFTVAAIIVLVMLVWGALQWILSGGDKDGVSHARNRILHALIGLAILAVAFALASVFGQFVGVDLFNLKIPTPLQPTPYGTR